MITCYLGLGSNLHSPRRMLRLAIKALSKVTKTSVLKHSALYRSKPWGIHSFQPDYYNMVVKLRTDLPPEKLLLSCQAIETELGRTRSKKWQARTLDIDLLLYGSRTISHHELMIPHPRMLERNFVLQPLLQIAPDLTMPDGRLIRAFFKANDECHLDALQ